MANLIYGFSNFFRLLGKSDAESSLDPIYQALSTIGPYAISVVLICTILYGIIFGVKFAKAEGNEDKAKLQKALINGLIGFITVLILIIILYAIRGPLSEWMNS